MPRSRFPRSPSKKAIKKAEGLTKKIQKTIKKLDKIEKKIPGESAETQ